MRDLRMIGLLAKEGSEYIFIPISDKLEESVEAGEADNKEEKGGIAVAPTPKEAKISKEQVKDYSADGILKKYTMPKEGV